LTNLARSASIGLTGLAGMRRLSMMILVCE
jgi:hypothetical protein